MITLGLDPSKTNFGWAIHDSESKSCLDRGRIRTEPKHFEDEVDRMIYIREEVTSLIRTINPDNIGCEQSVFGSSQSPAMYVVYMTALEAIKRNQKNVVVWSPTQVKSLARTLVKRPAKWKMEKPDMIEAAQNYLGQKDKWNDNEADAFLIGIFSSKWWAYHNKEGIEDTVLTDEELWAFSGMKINTKGKKEGKIAYKGIEHAQGEKFFLWSQIETENIGVKKQPTSSRRKTKNSIQKK